VNEGVLYRVVTIAEVWHKWIKYIETWFKTGNKDIDGGNEEPLKDFEREWWREEMK
jgi:hypothetical protein